MATNQATLQKERANNQGKTEVTRKLHRNKERTIWMIVAFMVWNITKEKGQKKRIPRTTTKAATINHSSTSTIKNVLVASMDLKNQEKQQRKSETMKSWPW